MYCVISAPVETRSGYGEHARDFIRALINSYSDWNIKIIPQRWGDTPRDYLEPDRDQDIISRLITEAMERQPDIWIQITVPNEFQPIGKYNIGITAGAETTRPPGQFVEGINRMDLTIVPSEFVKDAFKDNIYELYDKRINKKVKTVALEKAIEVIFEGVNTDIFKPIIVDHENDFIKGLDNIEEDFCFLFVGHWLGGDIGHDRKDVGTLIKTFSKAFKDVDKKPALVLKTSTGVPSTMDYEEINKRIERIIDIDNGPNIYLIHGSLTPEEMNMLYNHEKIKGMVMPTHGEGFGRPLLEFSLIGKPIITSNWSGHLDFLDSRYSLLIPGTLKNVHPSVGMPEILLKESKWFYADPFYLQQYMVELYNSYDKYKKKAEDLMNINTKKYTLGKMEDKIKIVFDENLPSFPKELELALPKLKKINV